MEGRVLNAIANLRLIAKCCREGQSLEGELARWLGEGLESFLAHRAVSLHEALALRFRKEGCPGGDRRRFVGATLLCGNSPTCISVARALRRRGARSSVLLVAMLRARGGSTARVRTCLSSMGARYNNGSGWLSNRGRRCPSVSGSFGRSWANDSPVGEDHS